MNDIRLEPMLSAMDAVCVDFTDKATKRLRVPAPRGQGPGLVFAEPYSPFLTSPDATVLVLGEAQNLSANNREYVNRLVGLEKHGRFRRLHLGDGADRIGIEPWDNGMLQLACMAAHSSVGSAHLAVSNAVPWSFVTESQANDRPFTRDLIDFAGAFWAALFDVWRPQRIVAAGAVAQAVMVAARQPAEKVLPLVLPSPRWNGAAGMFWADDLVQRFGIAPEVVRRIDEFAAKEPGKPTSRKTQLVFYACHAASRARMQAAGVDVAVGADAADAP